MLANVAAGQLNGHSQDHPRPFKATPAAPLNRAGSLMPSAFQALTGAAVIPYCAKNISVST
jgi:hypothetical protein